MPAAPKTSDVLAAVDLGSNSFHMKIARAYEGELQVLDRMREAIHLGAGLDSDGNITPEVQRRALQCLARFGERLRGLPGRSVRIVGTNTLRNARNAKDFIAAAEKATGFPIKIISGKEEARLIYLGVAHTLADNGQRRLVIDIGGGSTELIVGEHSTPINIASLEMGCVSFSCKYFDGGEITQKRWQRARTAALEIVQQAEDAFRNARWEHAVGASGTIRAINSLGRIAGWSADGITRDSLERLSDALLKAGDISRLKTLGLNADRAPVFPGGVAILSALFEALDLKSMRVSDGALREGMLFDMLGWPPEEDTCASSVTALAARFHVDAKQANRVEQTVLQLLQQVAIDWELKDPSNPRFLAWAAHLHEIGLDIASNQHHKHGAYVAENADLDGFTMFEQKLLGVLLRAQRGKFPSAAFKDIPTSLAISVQRLSILLRLATILHRSRTDEPLPRIVLGAGKRSLKVQIAKSWLDAHPLVRSDLMQEENYLREVDFTLELP